MTEVTPNLPHFGSFCKYCFMGTLLPVISLCNSPFPLLQQLVQFIINGFDVRADNDLTGVLPRTDDACCACRFYSLLIDLTVVLDLKAQAGSAVAGAYYITPPACAAFAVELTNELLLHFTSAVRTDPFAGSHKSLLELGDNFIGGHTAGK